MNPNYEQLSIGNKQIYLIGTAHISDVSRRQVNETINEIKPDCICIELDEERYQKMNNPESYEQQDIYKIIKDKKVNFLLVNIILAAFQKRMANQLDTESGNEMREAMTLAKELNCHLELIDRSISLTFSRIWGSLSLFEKAKLLATIIMSIFDNDQISEEELANLKQGEALDAALSEVSKEFPNVKKVLVDERDQFLAYKIKHAPGEKIVAIIGAAHIPGIKANIVKNYSIDDINKKIEVRPSSRILKWIIPIALLTMIILMFIINFDKGVSQLKNWIIINGSFSAIGTLLVGGHILSALVAFVAAPFTSMNPLLAAGFFAGFTEAWIRKPKAKDFESISTDSLTLKGLFSNRVIKVLLVVLSANIFSSIATFISGFDIVKNFLNLL